MLRTVESGWPSRLRGTGGWLLLAIVVTFISFNTALLVFGSPKLSLLVLAGLGGFFMLLILLPNPHLGPYLVFLVMPFSGWAYKESPGSGFNFLLDALIVVACIAVLLNRKHVPFPQQLGVPIIFLLLLGLIQTLNPSSGGTEVTAMYAIRDNLVPLLLFFVGLYAFRSSGQVLAFLVVIQLVAIGNGAWALQQVLFGLQGGEARVADPSRNPTWWIDDQLRAFATLDGPWSYAYDATLAVVLGICLFIVARSWSARSVALIGVIFAGTGLYLTLVRTSWLMVPIALLVVGLLQLQSRLRLPAILALASAALIMLMVMVGSSLPTGYNPSTFGQVMAEFNIFEDESMEDRVLNWGHAVLPAILTYPFGKGLGTTGGVGAAFNPGGSYTTDSTYFTMALEFGLMGLGLYLFILFAALRLGLRLHARTRDRLSSWLVAGTVGIIIATIAGDFINTYANAANGSMFYFLLGLMAFVGNMPPAAPPERQAARATPLRGQG